MCGREEFPVALEQVRFAVDHVLGGYENSVADGHMQHHEIPDCMGLMEEIFYNLRHCHYGEGFEGPGSLPEVQHCSDDLLKGMIVVTITNTHFDI